MVCEEDYLGAAGGEGGCYDGADAGCSTLVFIMSCSAWYSTQPDARGKVNG